MQPIKAGLLIIDQHRAHQRVLYEHILRNLTVEQGASQTLLFPLKLSFTLIEMALLSGIEDQLKQAGFGFVLNEETMELSGIPSGMNEANVQEIIEQLIHDIQHQVPDSHFSQSDLIAKSLSKNSALRAGVILNKQEQEHLVNSLFACKEPNTTPSGAKTFITIDAANLEQRFN